MRNIISKILFFTVFFSIFANNANACAPFCPDGIKRFRGFNVTSEVTKADIKEIRRWHGNFVRFQLVFPPADYVTVEEYWAWFDESLDKLDRQIRNLKKRGIYVLIDLHTPPGGFIRDAEVPVHRMFYEPDYQQDFLDAWREIARRFGNEDIIWGFDLLNEPAYLGAFNGAKTLDELFNEAVAIIREETSEKVIVIEPPFGNSLNIEETPIVLDPNLVLSIHLYEPLDFTHQGIGDRKKVINYPNPNLNKNTILEHLNIAKSYADAFKYPIYVGEFSSVRWAPNGSSARYLRDAIKIFEKYKWSWSYHAWRESNVWNLEFKNDKDLTEKSETITDRGKVVKKFLRKNLKSNKSFTKTKRAEIKKKIRDRQKARK